MNRYRIDRWFPYAGRCAICGYRDKRHRIIDTIKGRHKAGESIAALARDYEVSRRAIEAALAHRFRPKLGTQIPE